MMKLANFDEPLNANKAQCFVDDACGGEFWLQRG
jgi:hypothetical protein